MLIELSTSKKKKKTRIGTEENTPPHQINVIYFFQ